MLDNALNQYLLKLLGSNFSQQFNTKVIDSNDISEKPLTDADAQQYVHNSQAQVIILMQIQGSSASFTVVKDQRNQEKEKESDRYAYSPKHSRD